MTQLSKLFFIFLITSNFSFAGTSNTEIKPLSNPEKYSVVSQQKAPLSSPLQQSLPSQGELITLLDHLSETGLLGSLLFDRDFERFNLVDFLFVGILALIYLLVNLFMTRNKNAIYFPEPYREEPDDEESSSDIFLGKKQTSTHFLRPIFKSRQNHFKNFNSLNEKNFLMGAKTAFKMLQTAWDKKDLAEIRHLTTDKVFINIQAQLKHSINKQQIDMLDVDSELLEVREIGDRLEATVLFDTKSQENIGAKSEQTREVWTFVKPRHSRETKWLLDGLKHLDKK